MCGGVSSGGRFRKVPEDSDVCWCRFRRQVPKVPEGSGLCGGEFQGFGRFRSGLLPCNLDRNSHVIVFEHLLVITLPAWAKPLRNKNAPM